MNTSSAPDVVFFGLQYCGLGLFVLFVALFARYAVTFVLKIRRPRGSDLEITHQIKGIEANNPTEAMKKGYHTLSPEQRNQVERVYMTRTDDEG